jgi:hypothetical protein
MTCAEQENVSKITNVHNLIQHFFNEECIWILKSLTRNGINSLREDYFGGRSTLELDQLEKLVTTAPHNILLGLFFLVLNVDSNLKEAVLNFESPQNHRKIERFLMDLKTPIVSNFCIDDTISIQKFIDQCWEAYIVA